jgi:hypothetical protein
MTPLERAVEVLEGWFASQGFRSDNLVMLHKYWKGKHQEDCPWCAVTEATALIGEYRREHGA